MSNPVIEAKSVHKTFGRTPALQGASLALAPGEVVAITGPSGSGKSTLLLSLAGVVTPDQGEVWHAGRRIDPLSERDRAVVRRTHCGLVLQFGQLVPELTVQQNVELPLLLAKVDRTTRRTAVTEWLERLGVVGLGSALPSELSGGEAQRVAIARALVAGPSVVFADEPTGALDTVGGEQVLEALLSASRESGASVLLVTHDNRVAARADREIVMRDGAVDNGLHQPAAFASVTA